MCRACGLSSYLRAINQGEMTTQRQDHRGFQLQSTAILREAIFYPGDPLTMPFFQYNLGGEMAGDPPVTCSSASSASSGTLSVIAGADSGAPVDGRVMLLSFVFVSGVLIVFSPLIRFQWTAVHPWMYLSAFFVPRHGFRTP